MVKMPRQIRYILPQIPHHAVQRGNNRQQIFFDVEDRKFYLSNLKKYSKDEKVHIGSYCLMTNHIHLLLYPESSECLIKFMKSLSQLHTQHINRKYRRTGKLWENRYKLHIVDPAYEWIIARYIERNPIRANMVTVAEEYSYSSARAHLFGSVDGLLTMDLIKGKRDEYKEFFNRSEADELEHLDKIRTRIQKEKSLGSDEFIRKLEDKFKVSFKIQERGRHPKKTE